MILGIISLFATVILLLLFARTGLTKNEGDRYGVNPYDFDPGTALKKGWVYLLLIIVVWSIGSFVHTVPSGYVGVPILFGKVQENTLPEGLSFKSPLANVIDMKVSLQVIEVLESTASQDLQEVTTKLAVHYNVNPDMANEVYREMRKAYATLLLTPVIQEDLKAVTAMFTAEELVTLRPLVVLDLEAKLRESVRDYGFTIQTINIIDFQFSDSFSKAIDAKVTAEQKALEAKNDLERIRWEQEQFVVASEAEARMLVITAEAEYNQTVRAAQASYEQVILGKQAEAQGILLEAAARGEAIELVAAQLTEEYLAYLYYLEWNGVLPSTMLSGANTGVLLNLPTNP